MRISGTLELHARSLVRYLSLSSLAISLSLSLALARSFALSQRASLALSHNSLRSLDRSLSLAVSLLAVLLGLRPHLRGLHLDGLLLLSCPVFPSAGLACLCPVSTPPLTTPRLRVAPVLSCAPPLYRFRCIKCPGIIVSSV